MWIPDNMNIILKDNRKYCLLEKNVECDSERTFIKIGDERTISVSDIDYVNIDTGDMAYILDKEYFLYDLT